MPEDTNKDHPKQEEKDSATEESEKDDTTKENVKDHPVFEAIKDCKDDVELIRNFFEIDGLSVEKLDSSGMTVLMHACWKGFEKIVKFLIKQVGQFLYYSICNSTYFDNTLL